MIEKPRKLPDLPATLSGPRPGDFAVGSAQSRAAARALVLARQPQLTQWNRECLLLVRISEYLHAAAWPSYSEMEQLPPCRHGWELGLEELEKLLEPLRRPLGPCPFARVEYATAHNRELLPGDILNSSDIKPSIQAEDLDEWRIIWDRLVPEYAFPFKWADGLLLCALRSMPPAKSAGGHLWISHPFGAKFPCTVGPGLKMKLSALF